MLNSQRLLCELQKLPTPSNYLIAYSGGLDSHVLLHLLAAVREQRQIPIQAMHIQHGLHAAAEQWARHCLATCQTLDVPCTVKHLHLEPKQGESLEALARDARYAALQSALSDKGMLLTAHHADDQAETFLLQLLRGAGIAGLAAMPQCREWYQGWHARPVLTFTQAELQAYAKQHQLNWIEDPSNQNTDFDRNYLRQQIVPLLQARWPAANKTISRSAAHLADLLPIIQVQAKNALQACLNQQGNLSIKQLEKFDQATQNLLLRAWIEQAGHPTPRQTHLAQIQRSVLNAGDDTSPEVCWSNSILRRYRDELWLMSNQKHPVPQRPVYWVDTPELELPAGCGRLTRKPATRQGIPDRLWHEGKISVRWRSEGIKCQPLGRNGQRSFKKLCQEYAIPPWQRPYLPLVYADNQLIAVADYCLCEGIDILPDDTLSCLVYSISQSSNDNPSTR